MITVWGRATSVNVQAVMWALAELGIACERIDVGGAFGGLDTPEFRAMNPNGRIPVLRDRRRLSVGERGNRPLSRRAVRKRRLLAGRSAQPREARQMGGVDEDQLRPGIADRHLLAARRDAPARNATARPSPPPSDA